jgi:hypothetical protein
MQAIIIFPYKNICARFRVRATIGLIFLFVYAFAQTKLSVFNFNLLVLAAVYTNSVTPDSRNDFTPFFNKKNTSASWKIVVIVWFFGHTILNFLLLFNQAMTALNMNESQCEMK